MRVVIDLNGFYEYANELRRLRKYDYPLAVRATLNDTARVMKTKTIRPEFKENFIVRRPTFITAFTGYEKCKNTFDVHQMSSRAGTTTGPKDQKLGYDLQKQEFGGRITNRAVPTNIARINGAHRKTIRQQLAFRRFKSKKTSGTYPMGQDEIGVIIKTKDGRIVRRFNEYNKKSKDAWRTIYTNKMQAKINKEPFIKPAGLVAARQMPMLFKKNAEKRFKKFVA